MPVTGFKEMTAGYNPSYLFAVDKFYGTENELKSLIDSCHADIAVIMDLVINYFAETPHLQIIQ